MILFEKLQPLIYILIGWLLGFLSTALNMSIEKRKRKINFNRKFISEMKVVLPRLVSMYFELEKNIGKIDREVLKWASLNGVKYNAVFNDYDSKIIKDYINMSDEEIKKLALELSDDISIGKEINKVYVQILQEPGSDIKLFGLQYQIAFLKIQLDIKYINEIIEWASFYYRKTFEDVREDYKIIVNNELRTYGRIADKSKIAVDDISEIISKYYYSFF